MKTALILLMTAAAILMMSSLAMAGPTGEQTVILTVPPIINISVSGNPGALVISDPGNPLSDPSPVTDSTSKYNIWTNVNAKITGAINSNMPSGLTLKINLTAPAAGGTSAGNVTLTTTATNLVTGITPQKANGTTITYTLNATSQADPGSGTRTITLTITQ